LENLPLAKKMRYAVKRDQWRRRGRAGARHWSYVGHFTRVTSRASPLRGTLPIRCRLVEQCDGSATAIDTSRMSNGIYEGSYGCQLRWRWHLWRQMASMGRAGAPPQW
jgi:hypothetical protein